MGSALRGLLVLAARRRRGASILSGPTRQFIPSTSTSRSSITAAKTSTEAPVSEVPSSAKAMCAIRGISGRASRMPMTAAFSSLISVMVSTISPSHPASARMIACSLNASRHSKKDPLPDGAGRHPVEDRSPKTSTFLSDADCAARRARRIPSALSSAICPSRPDSTNLRRFPPKVLAKRISAPASTYSRCNRRTLSGCLILRTSEGMPPCPISKKRVPYPPSKRRIFSFN